MATANRVSMRLLDEDLKSLINASAKIFPITQVDVDVNNNPNNYEYGRVENAIYRWNKGKWEYIVADDIDISWLDIKDKPIAFTPSEHTHSEFVGISEHITNIGIHLSINDKVLISTIESKASKDYVDTELAGKSDKNHNHDERYADKSFEEMSESHEERLYNIENGYTEGHSHANLLALNLIKESNILEWEKVINKADLVYVDVELSKKLDKTTFSGHTDNSTVHVTQVDKDGWSGKAELSDIPTTLPASGGEADTAKSIIGLDTRAVNSPPSEYMNGGSLYVSRAGWQTEFKQTAILGVSAFMTGIYCFLETKNPWSDSSGGYPIQIVYGNGNPIWRVGISNTAWGAWSSMGTGVTIGTVRPTDRSMWYKVIG